MGRNSWRMSLLFSLLFLCLVKPAQSAELFPTQSELMTLAGALEGDHWYGIYFTGKKVGWQRESWKKSGEHICVEIELEMALAVLGSQTRTRSLSHSCYSTLPPNLIDEYEMVQEEDESRILVTMEKHGESLVFSVTANGNSRQVPVPAARERLQTALPWAVHARMIPGDFVRVTTFDPVVNRNRVTTVTLKERADRVILGSKQSVTHIAVAEEGSISLDGWLSFDGKLLEGTVGSVFRITAEDQATARLMDVKLADVYLSTFVAATGNIDYSRVNRVKRMVAKLTGNSEFVMPVLPRQRTLQTEESWTLLEIDACSAPNLSAPLDEDIICNADIPCDLEHVKQVAREAAGDAKEPLAVVLAVSQWIHKSFRYTVGGSSGTADLLLRRRTGDCSEFAKVMVLLARSLGLPAREVTGIVLANDQPLTFGYHAWAQIFLPDTGWTDVDPTWGHHPVDATHIALGVREDLAAVIQFGALVLEIREVVYSDGELSCPSAQARSQDLPHK